MARSSPLSVANQKRHWYKLISDNAEALRPEGISKEANFSRYLTTNPTGILLHQVMKSAPNDEGWNGENDDDDATELDDEPIDDKGYVSLKDLAIALQKDNPGKSYVQCFEEAANRRPDLLVLSKQHTMKKIYKSWQPMNKWAPASGYDQDRLPTVGTGTAGSQKPGLDQYRDLMARAEHLNAQGKGNGRSVAQIFSDLWQNKSRAIPGQDDMGTGNDKSAKLQGAEKITRLRRKTTKSMPYLGNGDEGFTRSG